MRVKPCAHFLTKWVRARAMGHNAGNASNVSGHGTVTLPPNANAWAARGRIADCGTRQADEGERSGPPVARTRVMRG